MRRKRLLLGLAGLMIATTCAKAQSTRQLVAKAKASTVAIWDATSFSARVDEHDLLVQFRVSGGDERVRESLMAFIDLTAEFAERQKTGRELFFSANVDCPAVCTFVEEVPLPRPKPPEHPNPYPPPQPGAVIVEVR